MKGQFSFFDVASAFIIFLILLAAFQLFISNFLSQIQSEDYFTEKSWMALDRLIHSGGAPFDWNSTSFEVIGIAYERGVISELKLAEFVSISDYDEARKALGVSPFQCYFSLEEASGALVSLNGTSAEFGVEPDASAVRVGVARAPVVFSNGSRAVARMVVWE